jgi:hypothetical protein
MAKRSTYFGKCGPLILLMCFFSCKKVIDLKLNRSPRLALHGYVAIGETFSATISISGDPANADNMLPLKTALVALYENGTFKDSLLYNPQQKKHVSRWAIAEYGKTYTIRAAADGYPSVEATDAAPAPVPTIAIAHKKNARLTDDGDFLDDVQFTIQDPGAVKNYYLTALYPSPHFPGSMPCVYSTDPVIDRPQSDVLPLNANSCINAKGFIFNDQSFNGSAKQITISARPEILRSFTDSSGFVHKPYLKRHTINEEFYTYYKHIMGKDFETGIPNSNVPATSIGNVTNGYGLFTIYSVTTDSLP